MIRPTDEEIALQAKGATSYREGALLCVNPERAADWSGGAKWMREEMDHALANALNNVELWKSAYEKLEASINQKVNRCG